MSGKLSIRSGTDDPFLVLLNGVNPNNALFDQIIFSGNQLPMRIVAKGQAETKASSSLQFGGFSASDKVPLPSAGANVRRLAIARIAPEFNNQIGQGPFLPFYFASISSSGHGDQNGAGIAVTADGIYGISYTPGNRWLVDYLVTDAKIGL